MYKFNSKSNKKMLKKLSRKINKQSKRISKRISKKISRRLNKTIRNDSTKVRQFYKSMLKKFKGGCTSCATIGGKPMKGGWGPVDIV